MGMYASRWSCAGESAEKMALEFSKKRPIEVSPEGIPHFDLERHEGFSSRRLPIALGPERCEGKSPNGIRAAGKVSREIGISWVSSLGAMTPPLGGNFQDHGRGEGDELGHPPLQIPELLLKWTLSGTDLKYPVPSQEEKAP